MRKFWRLGRPGRQPAQVQAIDDWNLIGYDAWIEKVEALDDATRGAIRERSRRFDFAPLVSILMPAYETDPAFLAEAIDSVSRQLYANWELCVVDDASPSPHVAEILTTAAAKDPRIKWSRRPVNGHISAASNTALAMATGSFVALMDHDDTISETALYEVVAELDRRPETDIVFSDEDKVDATGRRFDPYLKGGWNPEVFYGHNVLSHFCVFRRSILDAIGGFRIGLEGSQDYDLSLRAVARTSPHRIRHVPSVLYHWRASDTQFSQAQLDKCLAAARKAKIDFFEARGEPVDIVSNPYLGFWDRVKRPVPQPAPLVTLIVAGPARPWQLERLFEGLAETDYDNIEVIVEGGRAQTRAARKFAGAARPVHVRERARGMSREDWLNDAAAAARGSVIGFVAAGLLVIDAGWLTELCSLAAAAQHGVVGPKILAYDDAVLHDGYVLSPTQIAVAPHRGVTDHRDSYFGRLKMARHVSAVSRDCLFVRKSVFERAGGFDAAVASFADIDLCLKVADLGLANVWTPFANLKADRRLVEKTWGQKRRARADAGRMRQRWSARLAADPFHSPNLKFDLSGPVLLADPKPRFEPEPI